MNGAKGTMKAAQFDKKSGKVLINDVPIPEPTEGQLLVKMTGASLCHSDLMAEMFPDDGKPLTMGHEGVGIVEKLHPSSEGKGFKVGDKIGMLYIVNCCFTCEGCHAHGTLCYEPVNGGAKVKGIMTDGFFSEYSLIDWEDCILLPDSLPAEKMSPLFCAGITGNAAISPLTQSRRKLKVNVRTAFHSVDRAELKPGEWFAVIGCGGLGQYAVQYAKAMGYKVIGLDVNDNMLQIAKQKGADAIINTASNPDWLEEVKKLTRGPDNIKGGTHGAAVYSNVIPAYGNAKKVLKLGGVLMVVGLPIKAIDFPAWDIVTQQYRVKGSNTGHPKDMKRAVDFTAKHQIIPEVDFKKLEDMPQMYEDMSTGKASKRMVVLFD
ncbi:GroES-like protein [Rhizodiscina lignyota]|uniref:GroES-like protein n=1 Tax=Rhizodiscina lignyota TaxID=1504668 RepID=A0A9P4IGK7_9PEZI|nr:GroES-like protein [Rhizodiscina lignyota]